MTMTNDSKYSFQITRGTEIEPRGWQLRFFKNGKPVGKDLHAFHPADSYEMALQFAFEWLQQHSLENNTHDDLALVG